jgi:hypothetical protein
MSRRNVAAVAAVLLSTAGCYQPPALQAVSAPPPLATATLVDDGGNASITITKGVALAFSCTDPTNSDPCKGLSATVADPQVASVSQGYLDTLSPSNPDLTGMGVDGSQPQSVLVVVGHEPGTTTLDLSFIPQGPWISSSIAIPVTVEDL